jgi:hypothetical protein
MQELGWIILEFGLILMISTCFQELVGMISQQLQNHIDKSITHLISQ